MTQRLPLSDRLLFSIASAQHTARSLIRLHGKAPRQVYPILNRLQHEGLIQEANGVKGGAAGNAAIWELVPGVTVRYRPRGLIVERDGEPTPVLGDDSPDEGGEGQCQAITAQGERCQNTASEHTYCGIHAKA